MPVMKIQIQLPGIIKILFHTFVSKVKHLAVSSLHHEQLVVQNLFESLLYILGKKNSPDTDSFI